MKRLLSLLAAVAVGIPGAFAAPDAPPQDSGQTATSSKGTIYVKGRVRCQGAIDLPEDGTLTVSQAILLAGGFDTYANQRRVRLVRKTSDSQTETTIVNIRELREGLTCNDPRLQKDDTVIVPEILVNF